MNTNTILLNAVTDPALTGPNLYPWDFGSHVAELQELLRAHGFRLRIDGDFGSTTEAAVKAFQRQHGLRVDGVVDIKTWTALKTKIQPGTRILKQGRTGGDVRELQGLLRVHGYHVSRNGIFDDDTKQAVISFQEKHKLKPNGIVDFITWTVLRAGSPLPTPTEQTGWFLNFRKWW